jgi:hypothetical protein
MAVVEQQAVPDDALLRTYRGGKHPELWGRYGDCFTVRAAGTVSLAQWVFAFYTSPIFKMERLLLRFLAKAPSSDQQAREIAEGRREAFAVWVVGARTQDQLLMCDRYGRTRSWFRVVPEASGGTILQFGSAVAARIGQGGAAGMGHGFKVLLAAHKIYSRLLISAAKNRIATHPSPRF